MDRIVAMGYMGGDHEDPASTRLNLCARLIATGRYEQAIAELEGLVTDPVHAANPRVLMTLAQAYLQRARRAKSREEEDAEPWLSKAERTVADAHRALQQAAATVGNRGGDDGTADVLLLRARIAENRDRLDEAERLARQAAQLRGWSPNVHNTLSAILKARMDVARDAEQWREFERLRKDAESATRRALELEPRQWHALDELGHLLLERRGDVDVMSAAATEAIQHLNAALELIPRSPRSLNNRSIAEMRLGVAARMGRDERAAKDLLEEALASVETALEQRPEYPRGWANKAYVLWQLGRLDEALETARHVHELDPGYRLAPRFVQSLARTGRTL